MNIYLSIYISLLILMHLFPFRIQGYLFILVLIVCISLILGSYNSKNSISIFTLSGLLAITYFSYSIHVINYKYETGLYAIDADSLGLGYAYAFLDSFYIFTLAVITIYGMRFICQGFSKKLFKR